MSTLHTRKDWARRVLSLLDLTSLNETDDDQTIIALCEQALESPVKPAAVCVNPAQAMVPIIVLRDSGIRSATVANFPHGDKNTSMASFEVLRAVNDGVEEVDVVFPYHDWEAGKVEECQEFVEAAKSACGVLAKLKVILETGELKDAESIDGAARLAIDCGADFIKTSTGKVPVNATLEAAEVMLKAISDLNLDCGFKAAGGVKTLEEAVAYIRLAEDILGEDWVTPEHFRIGASSLMQHLLDVLAEPEDQPFDADAVFVPACPMPQEIIRQKRDGKELSDEQIQSFIAGLGDDSVNDAQVAAFAMSVFFNGMNDRECSTMTLAMRDSGDVMDWKALGLGDAPIVDKHSTGGVGDKVSLILAPLVAACGVKVPMISGRGLGHTGGTLDKLASIPGYNATPNTDDLAALIQDTGCAVIGQTDALAPADRRMYAIRDISASVESLPLIVASILSKKLAAGLTGLVFDVKSGSGAFMETDSDAKALASRLVQVAKAAGLPATALITDMNQVLGRNAGNALEVAETVSFLTGAKQDPCLREVVLALASNMLVLAGQDAGTVWAKVEHALDSGAAAEIFAKMVTGLGGPADFVDRFTAYLPTAPIMRPVYAKEAGYISAMNVRELGLAVIDLGGGRTHHQQPIDLAVGIADILKVGDEAHADHPLCMLHARDEVSWDRAAARIRDAVSVAFEPVSGPELIRERITAA